AVSIASGATVTQAAGTLSLTAGGSLTAPKVDNGTADITAPTISLKAGGTGTIGASAADRVEINATTLDATTAGGNIFITDTAGGVAVGRVSAGTGDVTLPAVGGSITPQFGGSGATLSITTSGGVITGATLVNGGSGYPASATVDLAVTGGGGSGGIVAVTTDASGVVTGLAGSPIVAGGS